MSYNNGPANTKPDTATASAFKTATTPATAAMLVPHKKHKGHSNGPSTGAPIEQMAPNPSAPHHSKG